MLGGGLETGTSCLIVGASGAGKSSLAALYAAANAAAGAHTAILLFDERPQTYLRRSSSLGIDLRGHIEAGRLLLEQLDPGEIAPGEFAQYLRGLVEDRGTKAIVIDSLVGYFAAMGSARELVTQLHELITYLTRNDVLLILCGVQEGFMSIGTQEIIDVSYLSDTIIALAFFEVQAKLRRAITVVKKKHGPHALDIHELMLREGAIDVVAGALSELSELFVRDRLPVGGGPERLRDDD
jgi:circadian clock protein KaiC